jgi:N-acetylglucosamine transport system substrate-binding protein
MKKLVSILVFALVAFTTVWAGGKKDANAKNTLQVAAIETAYGSQMWVDVVAAFKAENPDVTIELITDKKLEDVISPNMKAGDYPDVVHLALGRPAAVTETLIKENALLDLTSMLAMQVPGESKTVQQKIAGGFTESSLTNPYSDGKTYLAPMFYSPCGLFYNEQLLKDNGWTVPTTWDEMWVLGDKAKAKGIALFTYPTAGYFDAFFYALVYEVGGADFFDKVTNYAPNTWDLPEGKTVVNIIAKLASYTEKSVPANANNTNFLKNQQLVLDNKAIFMPNGTWIIGEMADAPRAAGFKWGFTALPKVTASGDSYSYTWFEQAWIPAKAKNPELAKKFLAFLYSDKAAAIFANAGAVQPIVGFADTLEGDNALFYSIYDRGAKAAMGNFAATDPVEGVSIADAVFEAVNSLVNGTKTAETYVADIKKASDALRPALKK